MCECSSLFAVKCFCLLWRKKLHIFCKNIASINQKYTAVGKVVRVRSVNDDTLLGFNATKAIFTIAACSNNFAVCINYCPREPFVFTVCNLSFGCHSIDTIVIIATIAICCAVVVRWGNGDTYFGRIGMVSTA